MCTLRRLFDLSGVEQEQRCAAPNRFRTAHRVSSRDVANRFYVELEGAPRDLTADQFFASFVERLTEFILGALRRKDV